MFYAYNAQNQEYRFGTTSMEMTVESAKQNIPNFSENWTIVQIEDDLKFVNGKMYPKSQIPTEEIIAEKVRQIRNILLQQSDWTQMSDNGLSVEQKEKWIAYRQSLRDISLQTDFPENVEFPSSP